MKKIKFSVRSLVVTAILSALAAIIMFFEFSLPIFPDFLKIDFSEIPALMATFAISPVAGAAVVIIKNLIHVTMTKTGGIGELANMMVGIAFVVPAGYIYARTKSKQSAITGMLSGTLIMAITAAPLNYFVLFPLYSKFMPIDKIVELCNMILPVINSAETVILFTIIPFNILKGFAVSFLTFILYKKLSPILHRAS